MARLSQIDLPGVPQHVVLGAGEWMPGSLASGDRPAFLELLREACTRHACALHAYVLMDYHVSLLLTPGAGGAVLRVMQMLARGGVAHAGGHDQRTAPWADRYKACMINPQTHLLACMRHIELDPVRAWMVGEPDAYRWSSHGVNAYDDDDSILTPHAAYQQLGRTPAARSEAYRATFSDAASDAPRVSMRAYLARSQNVIELDQPPKQPPIALDRVAGMRTLQWARSTHGLHHPVMPMRGHAPVAMTAMH